LYDTLDTGLRAQLDAAVQELTSDGRLPPFRPNDDPVLVERADGVVVQASPAAAGLTLTPEQRQVAQRRAALLPEPAGPVVSRSSGRSPTVSIDGKRQVVFTHVIAAAEPSAQVTALAGFVPLQRVSARADDSSDDNG
jgi:hypothetical protein